MIGMGKASAIARSNIALIKYWGKMDSEIRLPTNSNISMTKEGLRTTTTVDFSADYNQDEVEIDDEEATGKAKRRVEKHLDRIRDLSGEDRYAKVVSRNNFPTAAGLASSASGFAALSLAGTKAVGMDLSRKELSVLARKGSGSATRSIHGGFVEWRMGASDEDSYAVQIAEPDEFDLRAVIAVANSEQKDVSSTAGHKKVTSSPFFQARLAELHKELAKVRTGIKENDFSMVGLNAERNALSMHMTMMTSRPSLFYWSPATLRIIKSVQRWRLQDEVESYFTVDAGPNVHILCQTGNLDEIKRRVESIEGVEDTITAKPGRGAEETSKHLF